MAVISCACSDGTRFDISLEALNVGFSERSTYHFIARKDWALYVDDVRLEIVNWEGEAAWQWKPGFFAGEVMAELFDERQERVGICRLDVSPDSKKLGGETFSAMVDEILDFDPTLLFGTEDAQVAIGAEGGMTSDHLQYSRLRRYGDRLVAGLKQITQKPLTTLRRERGFVRAHQVKRLDTTAIRKAFGSPCGRALLHPEVAEKPPLNEVRFDVPTAYEDQDNAANQAVGLILSEVIRRCKKVSIGLSVMAAKDEVSNTRSPLAPRLERRLTYLASLQARLERVNSQMPFRGLSNRRLSAAGLNAISSHPAYARAYRFGWFILRPGVLGKLPDESLWISPTWEVYERWCFAMVVQQLQRLCPHLRWKRHPSTKIDRILWRGVGHGTTIDVWLQVPCPAVDKKPYKGFQSLSRRRVPDIVVTLDSPAGKRFIVLDAKYRSSRFGVLDAMESAHLYHDCLRWNGYKADAVLLMIPQGGRVPILESPDFQASNGIGAVVMGGQEDAAKFGEQLVALLFCNASAYRSGLEGDTGW
ncbi:hypothetical protein PS673_02043 [Pseudomonas fluorescens]|jgi:hypothetical protein|uniref:DUF2357 domain-containing protein n=1 Tax=Pseudomonas fluorescens TaxID=294 RepID=A0A5E6SGC8_PSEFL|nr:nuclease domain-containing protein [Pseudomonas fluorescens]VVM76355.1 hypothetical protein PS673_02043 [Pseudomonas fluorescens]